MFSLRQVISMALKRNIWLASRYGSVQACWMHVVFLHAIDTTQPAHMFQSVRFIAFHQVQPTNTIRLTLPPPGSKYTQAEVICPLIDCTLTLKLTLALTLTLIQAEPVRPLIDCSIFGHALP